MKSHFHFKVILNLCLFWGLFFQFSCQKVKVEQLIPDSCQILVRINFPELISAKGGQQHLVDMIQTKWNFDLQNSGLDFYQPAYFFKTQFENANGYFLMAGIDSETSFRKTLLKLNPTGKIEEFSDFHIFDLSGAKVVWQKHNCILYFFNPISGPEIKGEDLSQFLVKENVSRGQDPFPKKEMVSFKAEIQEESSIPLLPPVEANIVGNAQLIEGKWMLDAVLKEKQILPFFLPFDMPIAKSGANKSCMIRLAVKPDWAKVGEALSGFFNFSFLNEAIDKMEKAEGPMWAMVEGCTVENIQKSASLAARFSSKQEADSVFELNSRIMKAITIPESLEMKTKDNWVYYISKGKTNHEFPQWNKSSNRALLWLEASQPESLIKLMVFPGSTKEEVKVSAEITNPEKIDFEEAENLFEKLPI